MTQEEGNEDDHVHQELSTSYRDPLIRYLHHVIRACVKMLAILMVLVIFLGVIDVFYHLYGYLKTPPFLLLNVSEIFEIFGAFMVVLIAIEIFINIRLYLGSNVLPIRLVIATALMAIARKVIVLDSTDLDPNYVFAIGVVTLALGITYWLIDDRSFQLPWVSTSDKGQS
ncbi:MAG: phosphate-starvation-inducible PsiE family protein [Halioglobus sp.]|nr:phosphate-starvation-inducible PsiE family protein [Halioglobus sp.]